MKNNEAGNLGMQINEFCFNNQAKFGDDIKPIPYKKNQEAPFTENDFAVAIKKSKIDKNKKADDCINAFVKKHKLGIDKSKNGYVIYDP